MTTAFYQEPKEHAFFLFAKRIYLFLLVWFLLFPFGLVAGGPRFTIESINCAMCLFWYVSPFLMLIVSPFSKSIWRVVLAVAASLAWLPMFIFGCVFWIPLISGVAENRNPFYEQSEVRPAGPLHSVCKYDVGFGIFGDSYSQRTFETHFLPGLKWVEIRETSDY